MDIGLLSEALTRLDHLNLTIEIINLLSQLIIIELLFQSLLSC